MAKPGSPRKPARSGLETINSRVRAGTATVDRIEPPRGEDWTGEFHRAGSENWLAEKSVSSSVKSLPAGPRGSNEHPDMQQTARVRPRGLWECRLRLAAALSLALLLLAVAVDAGILAAARFSGGGQPWREVSVIISSNPSGARVYIDGHPVGATPTTSTVYCRGRTIRVRVAAANHANWTWNGGCPARGALRLNASLKRLDPTEGGDR